MRELKILCEGPVTSPCHHIFVDGKEVDTAGVSSLTIQITAREPAHCIAEKFGKTNDFYIWPDRQSDT